MKLFCVQTSRIHYVNLSDFPKVMPLSLGLVETPTSSDSEDLINLQTPTHNNTLNPQSSIVAFTMLAQSRASASSEIIAQDRIDGGPVHNEGDGAQEGKKMFPLSKSQSAEFLDKIGNTPYSSKTLPKKMKNATSVENIADGSPKPAKTRTLPRPKLTRKDTKRKDSDTRVVPGETLTEAKKRLSIFEKSGEVFSLTESL